MTPEALDKLGGGFRPGSGPLGPSRNQDIILVPGAGHIGPVGVCHTPGSKMPVAANNLPLLPELLAPMAGRRLRVGPTRLPPEKPSGPTETGLSAHRPRAHRAMGHKGSRTRRPAARSRTSKQQTPDFHARQKHERRHRQHEPGDNFDGGTHGSACLGREGSIFPNGGLCSGKKSINSLVPKLHLGTSNVEGLSLAGSNVPKLSLGRRENAYR